MLLDGIPELYLYGVADRGVPNAERIVLQNLSGSFVELGQFALVVGFKTAPNVALPIRDLVIWFGDEVLAPGSWLFVYTGPGKPTSTTTSMTAEPARVLHWDKPNVIFSNPSIVPLLIKLGGITVDEDSLEKFGAQRGNSTAASLIDAAIETKRLK